MTDCKNCKKPVEEERIELLGSDICAECAKSGVGQDDVKAAMIYNEDGTTEVQVMGAAEYKRFQAMVNARDNMHSCA